MNISDLPVSEYEFRSHENLSGIKTEIVISLSFLLSAAVYVIVLYLSKSYLNDGNRNLFLTGSLAISAVQILGLLSVKKLFLTFFSAEKKVNGEIIFKNFADTESVYAVNSVLIRYHIIRLQVSDFFVIASLVLAFVCGISLKNMITDPYLMFGLLPICLKIINGILTFPSVEKKFRLYKILIYDSLI